MQQVALAALQHHMGSGYACQIVKDIEAGTLNFLHFAITGVRINGSGEVTDAGKDEFRGRYIGDQKGRDAVYEEFKTYPQISKAIKTIFEDTKAALVVAGSVEIGGALTWIVVQGIYKKGAKIELTLEPVIMLNIVEPPPIHAVFQHHVNQHTKRVLQDVTSKSVNLVLMTIQGATTKGGKIINLGTSTIATSHIEPVKDKLALKKKLKGVSKEILAGLKEPGVAYVMAAQIQIDRTDKWVVAPMMAVADAADEPGLPLPADH